MTIKQIINLTIIIITIAFIAGCDGYRQFRTDINLQKEQQDKKMITNAMIELAQKHNLQCKTRDNELYICYEDATNMIFRIDENNGILSIELTEFGPVAPTNTYLDLHKDLSEFIKTHFNESSVVMDPPRCSNITQKRFDVKLPSNRPALLYWMPWSVDSEFNKVSTEVKNIGEKYNMKCYITNSKKSFMGNINSSAYCVGRDYVGIWKSVEIHVEGDENYLKAHITITDRTCNESGLSQNLYNELLSSMTNIFGKDAIEIK